MLNYGENMKLKWIESEHNKYKNKSVWIVGSGHEIDTFPDNFIDNKIAISLHTAWLKWTTKFTYACISEVDRLEWFKVYRPDFFKTQGIYNNPFYLNVNSEWALPEEELKYGKHLFISYKAGIMTPNLMPEYITMALNGEHGPYMNAYTVSHTAILAAMILGFKKINLIGCNHSAPKNPQDFYYNKGQLQHMRLHNPKFNTWAAKTAGEFTTKFIDIVNDYNIKINRYLNYKDYKRRII